MTSVAVHSVNEWYSSFSGKRVIPPRKGVEQGYSSEGFALLLQEIHLNKAKEGVAYCVQVYFFDTKIRQFFGRPYRTEWTNASGKRIELHEELFFHCPVKGEDIQLIIEVIEASQNDTKQLHTVGWAVQPINAHNSPLQNYYMDRRTMQLSTLALFPGTPKVLAIASSVDKDGAKLQGVAHCVLLSHNNLLEASDYFPDFCIIGERDDIPGLKNSENEVQLAHPEMLPLVSASLDQIAISFGPYGEHVEKAILEQVNNDRLYRENHAPGTSSGQPMQILERRLRIGVHNGYTYLSEPMVVHLSSSEELVVGTHSLRRKGRTLSSNNMRSRSDALFVRTKVSIPKLCSDSRVTVVFALDYMMGIRTKDSTIHATQSVIICWGAWKPFSFESSNLSNVEASFQLVGGPRPNPEESLCFRNIFTMFGLGQALDQPAPQITIHFKFNIDEKDALSSRRSTSRNALDQTMPTPTPKPEFLQDSHVQREELVDVPRKEKRDELELLKRAEEERERENPTSERLPPISILRNPIAPKPRIDRFHDVIDRIIESPRKEDIHVYQPGAARVSSIPRSVYSSISRGKFPQIVDRNGDAPELVDIGTTIPMNETVETNDRLDTNEIVIQFMAVKWLNQFDLLAGQRVFFTFQFYRFPQITTEQLIIDESSPSDPGILKRLDGNDQVMENQGSGFMASLMKIDLRRAQRIEYILNINTVLFVKLTVDRSSLKSGDPMELMSYLHSNSLYVEVWDADSLMIVGTAQIPLKNLVRNGLEAVQSYVQCPIVQSALPESSKVAALLYLRMANIGHPSSNQIVDSDLVRSHNSAIVSRRLEKLGEESAESYRIRAKPLNPVHESALQRFLHAQRLDVNQRYAEMTNEHSVDRLRQVENLKKDGPLTNNSINFKKFIFDEELEAYKRMRHESKAARLLQAVFKGITMSHRIYPSLGQAEFFEYLLHSTYPEPVNCVVDIEESGLSVVTDPEEWEFYKRCNNLETPIERNLFSRNNKGMVEIFLKPMESVYVPFKYEDLRGSNHTDGQISQTKAVFKRWDTGDPLSILDLSIEHRPYAVNQCYRFIGEQMRNLNKIIRIAGVSGNRRVALVKCSDPTVKVGLKNNGMDQDLILTVYCGPSGSSKTFLVLLYSDQYGYNQVGIWKVAIHSMERLDVHGTQAQTSNIALNVKRSSHDNQLVHIFSSHPCLRPMEAQPTLITGDDQRITIQFTPEYTGKRLHTLTAVDVSSRDLLGAWIVYAESQQATITKHFEIKVLLSGQEMVVKKLPIYNSYAIPQTFRIISSRPELVQIDQEVMQLQPNTTEHVAIHLHPIVKKPIGIEVLVFIQNAETGQQEDTYSLRLSYITD